MQASDIKTFRHLLHSYPELSGKEGNTIQRIADFLAASDPSACIYNLGGDSFAAVYSFSEVGKTVVVRCELDALPIHEVNDMAYRSQHEGVSHKCGHDGHMAIVAGLAYRLRQHDLRRGRVVLLFQSAEETGQGAEKVVCDPRFQSLKPDYVLALHNIPKQPLHSIISTGSTFSAEVISFRLKVVGKECHASEPENGQNPTMAIAQLMTELSLLEERDAMKEDFALLTPVYTRIGKKAYGIAAGEGEVHYTLRTWNRKRMDALKESVTKYIEYICIDHGLQYEMDWFEYFPATQNDARCVTYIKQASGDLNLERVKQATAFRFGEDFGWYARRYPSAMFGLGAGKDTPDLHHADYDFPDEVIETGIDMFMRVIQYILDENP